MANINYLLKKLLILIAATTMSCWDAPLLTELATNRLEVKIMGTFSSDGSEEWDITNWFINDDSITDGNFIMNKNYPELFMLDLAEMRLSRGQSSGAKFSIYRQTFRIPLGTDNSSQHDFFNGNGIVLKNDDVSGDTEYHWVRLYIRKMIFDQALRYYYDDDEPDLLQNEPVAERVTFHERTVNGFDINLQQLNSKYDSLKRNNLAINRIFPLDVPIVGGLVFSNRNEKTVLEIRLNLKNYIKKYELIGNDEDNRPYILHYFAFADGLRDVLPGDTTIGGNILGVARTYVPGKTGTISGTITSGSSGYVIAIPAGDDIEHYLVRGNYRKDNVTKSEEPAQPIRQDRTIASRMNYYLKYENYKYQWNKFMHDIRNGGTNEDAQLFFETEWDKFDCPNTGATRLYKMPPLATRFFDNDRFEFKNVAPGEYDIYRIWTGDEYGILPDEYEPLGRVTVNSGDEVVL